MTYIYRIAGENLELAEAELKGFLKSQSIQEEPDRRNRIAETEKHPEMLKRLALTHEVSEKKAEIETDELEKTDIDFQVKGSFAVKCRVIEGNKEAQRIEEKLGNKLSSEENNVDLDNPDQTINAYILENKVLIGKEVTDINRGLYNQRSNEKRPFSSPVSLDPVLARVLVNLAEVPAGGKVLDPFCGTGGILIEAGLCGILPLGTDTKKEMVKGTRENLEEYGIINHQIKQEDAEKSLNVFEYKPDAIITDLPYGKASKVKGETEEKFLEIINSFQEKTVFMYDKPELESYSADYEIFVHKNLTRYIYIES